MGETDPFPLDMATFEALANSGVYFLRREGKVVYVGQALSLRRRICEHIGHGGKKFDSVSVIFCKPEFLNKLEQKHIRIHAPEYNNCPVAKKVRYLRSIAAPEIVSATRLRRVPRSSRRERVPLV